MTEPETDRPLRGRRLSWEEFYRVRPDLKPTNDNQNAAKWDRSVASCASTAAPLPPALGG